MVFSLRKYLASSLKWLIPFVALELLIFILHFTQSIEAGLFAVINAIDIVFLLLPGAYYLITFFVYKKKCKNYTPKVGVITNWENGFYRYTGCVILKEDDKEYSTSAYLSSDECRDMVGKTVSYAIISDTLFIYQIAE